MRLPHRIHARIPPERIIVRPFIVVGEADEAVQCRPAICTPDLAPDAQVEGFGAADAPVVFCARFGVGPEYW